MSAAALAVLRPARAAGQDLASGIFASPLALASGLSHLEPANDTEELRAPHDEVASESCHRLIKDHLGSVRRVVDVETGAVVRRLDFDSFGRVLASSGELEAVPFGFAGGLWEPATGLVRFGFRDYDPDTGRFTEKDPIRFDGGVNLYAYANNDPVNFVDRTGHEPDMVVVYFRGMNPWTGPTNALGLLYGYVFGEFKGFDERGTIIFTDTGHGYDRTIGDVICYGSQDESNRDHEMAHTDQHTLLGNTYIPAHLLMQGVSAAWTYADTGDAQYDTANPLEWGPNQSPPTPWGGP